MASEAAALFPTLFLTGDELPPGMTVYDDRRDGVSDPDDPSFARHNGKNIGMTKWDGADDSALRLFVDIRWLFPDSQAASAYHLETLHAKSEGKPRNVVAKTIGDDCYVYSYSSGHALGVARGMLRQVLDANSQMMRNVDNTIANMPDDAFIYLFTRGPVVVKFVAALGTSSKPDTGPATVHLLAARIVGRIESALQMSQSRKPLPWWKRIGFLS